MNAATPETDPPAGLVRTAQIIVVALAMGVVFFGGIVLLLGGSEPASESALVSLAMAILTLLLVVARIVVPPLVEANARRRIARGQWPTPSGASSVADTDQARLGQVFVMKTVIASALLEVAAFANLVAYLVESQGYSLILAALMLIGILLTFPLPSSASRWIRDQMRRLEAERSSPAP